MKPALYLLALGTMIVVADGCGSSSSGGPAPGDDGGADTGPQKDATADTAPADSTTPMDGNDSAVTDAPPNDATPDTAQDTGSDAGSDVGSDVANDAADGGLCTVAPGDGMCSACIKMNCCTELTACVADAECACFESCQAQGNATQQCRMMCVAGAPDTTTTTLVQCESVSCTMECP